MTRDPPALKQVPSHGALPQRDQETPRAGWGLSWEVQVCRQHPGSKLTWGVAWEAEPTGESARQNSNMHEGLRKRCSQREEQQPPEAGQSPGGLGPSCKERAMWLLGAGGWSALMVQERQGQGADRAGGVSKSKSSR